MAKRSRKKPQPATRRVKKKVRPALADIFTAQRRFWVSHWKEAVIVFISVVALYYRTLPYEFVLDDQIVISDNNYTKKGFDGIKDIFTHDSFTGYFGEQKDLVAGSRYRPLSLALFAIVDQFFGLNTRVYHGLNVLLYGLLCLLIFRVLSLLFYEHMERARWYASIPFIGTMVYALHPVHTEAIANIKGCDEILAMLGAMAALYAILRFVYRKSWFWLAASALLFFAGLMGKENTVTFLAVIPLTLYFFTKARRGTWMLATLPALAAALIYIAIRYSVIGYLFGATPSHDLLNNPFLNMNGSEKAATIMYTLGLYVKLLFYPHPLTHDYYPYHIPIMEWADIRTILSVAAYVVLFGLAIHGLLKKRIYGFASLYFMATLSIVSNIFFPIGTFMNERFLFMPSLGYCMVAGYYGGTYLHSPVLWKRALAGVLTLVLMTAFFWRSWVRIPAWKDAMHLNQAGVAVSKNSARANCFMGTALYKEAQNSTYADERLSLTRQAEIYVDRSLAIIPDYLSANQMKSGIAAEYYRFDRDLDKLLKSFAEILERKPNVDYIAQYCEYLNGQEVDVHKLLNFYYHVGYEIFSEKLHLYDYALKYLTYGYQLDPNDAKINYGMGKAYIGYGDLQRSQYYLDRAYSVDPSLRSQ